MVWVRADLRANFVPGVLCLAAVGRAGALEHRSMFFGGRGSAQSAALSFECAVSVATALQMRGRVRTTFRVSDGMNSPTVPTSLRIASM